MSLLAIKLENALCGYLRPLLPDFPLYRGHGNDDNDELPRAILTVTSGGGPLLLTAGVDELAVEILCLIAAGEINEEPDPSETLARVADVIRGAFALDNLGTIKAALNTPAVGADVRAVRGFGLTGLEYAGHKEGRDAEKAQHGVVLNYTAWAQLEA
jgi:hypothetical protein